VALGRRPPGTDDAFALVTPEVIAGAIQAFLDSFTEILPKGLHACLLLDGAGRHIAADITVPANVSLIFLPPDRLLLSYSQDFMRRVSAIPGLAHGARRPGRGSRRASIGTW
jgi:hypothetical protein